MLITEYNKFPSLLSTKASICSNFKLTKYDFYQSEIALCCRFSLCRYLHNITLKLVSISLIVTNLFESCSELIPFMSFFLTSIDNREVCRHLNLSRILQSIQIKNLDYLKVKSNLHRPQFVLKHLIHLPNHYQPKYFAEKFSIKLKD